MSQSDNTLSIRLFEKDYQVACKPEEKAKLLEASEYLDDKVKGLLSNGRVISSERVAVMAALNICYELMELKASSDGQQDFKERMQTLNENMQSSIDKFSQPS